MSNDLGAFLIVSTVVIVTPGQDTALTIVGLVIVGLVALALRSS